MDHTTTLPECSWPLLAEDAYPSFGGGELSLNTSVERLVLMNDTDIAARVCADFMYHNESVHSCCLPCPVTDWIYSDSFPQTTDISNYIAIASLTCNVFLLLTFTVVRSDKPYHHYLCFGIIGSVTLVAIAFVIPLGTHPDLCFNAITPDDQYTDLSCMYTAVLIEIGGVGAVVWSEVSAADHVIIGS